MDPKSLTAATALTLGSGCMPANATADLPAGFVRLADLAPAITQDMRYAGSDNFTGRPVPGYGQPQCWLRREVAAALAAAAQAAAQKGWQLVVYDCYRPPRATRAFLQWTEDRADEQTKQAYYPSIDKSDLFDLGYLAKVSTHSRGIAVDVAFAEMDFGTPFDMFDPKSATLHPAITGDARKNRARLVALMQEHGFENLPNEWWHFTFSSLKEAPLVDADIE